MEGTFTLMWRQKTNTLDDEMAIDRNSTATLYEIGMKTTPIKMYLYIRDNNGVQPEKVEHVSV